MKSPFITLFIILFTVTFCSCNKWIMPAEMIGSWETEVSAITVRTEPEKWKFEFTTDSAQVKLEIHENKTASGSIGEATFENVKIKKNPGNPNITGITYIIKCGPVGKIYKNDPLPEKEVQLWLGPIENKTMDSELRYTQGWSQFPMAGLLFKKNN